MRVEGSTGSQGRPLARQRLSIPAEVTSVGFQPCHPGPLPT